MSSSPPLLDIVVTARPSWARVRSVVSAYSNLAGIEKCRLILVGPAISKRYGDISNQVPPGIPLNTFPTLRDSDDLSSVALSCIEGSEALARHWSANRPNCALVVADRTETLGIALTAALMQIPLIHLQGGEISGSIDDKIRDANTKLSDFHLTTNSFTKERLKSLGEPENRIMVVGCPSLDLVKFEMDRDKPWSPNELSGVGRKITPQDKYGIVMFHPDTLDEGENMLWIDALMGAIKNSDLSWFWFWPNPDHGTSSISKKLRVAREKNILPNVHFLINVSPEIFIRLALRAEIMLGNSSFGIRESSFIGLPVINIGERQQGRQRGNNVLDLLSPKDSELNLQILKMAGRKFSSSNLYGDGDAGLKSAQAISQWVPSLKRRTQYL
jgi:UDP-hydrolysing UDP-N-acetyl-D-glucosamine 2-epimerase